MCEIDDSYQWHDSLLCAHDSFMSVDPMPGLVYVCVTWLIHLYYMWHDSMYWSDPSTLIPTCKELIHEWVMSHNSFICMTWRTRLIHLRDMTHSFILLYIRVNRLIHTCDMTDSHVWHGRFICETWLKSVDLISALVYLHNCLGVCTCTCSNGCNKGSCHTHERVMSHKRMGFPMHTNLSCHRWMSHVPQNTWHHTHMMSPITCRNKPCRI